MLKMTRLSCESGKQNYFFSEPWTNLKKIAVPKTMRFGLVAAEMDWTDGVFLSKL